MRSVAAVAVGCKQKAQMSSPMPEAGHFFLLPGPGGVRCLLCGVRGLRWAAKKIGAAKPNNMRASLCENGVSH